MVVGLCWAGGGARGGRRAQGGSGLGQMLGLKNEQRRRRLPSLAQTHECTSTRKFPGWGFIRAARMGMSPCTPARAPQHQGSPRAPLHVQTSTTNPPLHVQTGVCTPLCTPAPRMPPSPCPPSTMGRPRAPLRVSLNTCTGFGAAGRGWKRSPRPAQPPTLSAESGLRARSLTFGCAAVGQGQPPARGPAWS